MRLINARTLQLHEFQGDSHEEYAILSHRWGDGEVSFQDFLEASHGTRGEDIKQQSGYAKIKAFCDLTLSYGLEWGWADVCCINQSSSAELSEAINSMFRWYKEANLCIAFLNDVDHRDDFTFEFYPSLDDWEESSQSPGFYTTHKPFCLSEWFTRGWTLQELLAPDRVEFYDCNWKPMGSRAEHCKIIYKTTDIPLPILLDSQRYPVSLCTVAERMRWSSERVTLRPEDQTYCLLGIFNVNMPLLYGEGSEKAFHRLQCAISEISNDESLFCFRETPLLAYSPRAFARMCHTSVEQDHSTIIVRQPYSLTLKSLRIKLNLYKVSLEEFMDIRPEGDVDWTRLWMTYVGVSAIELYISPLNCWKENSRFFMILFKRPDDQQEIYYKLIVSVLDKMPADWKPILQEVTICSREKRPQDMHFPGFGFPMRWTLISNKLAEYLSLLCIKNRQLWSQDQCDMSMLRFDVYFDSIRKEFCVSFPETFSDQYSSSTDKLVELQAFLDRCSLPEAWRNAFIEEVNSIPGVTPIT